VFDGCLAVLPQEESVCAGQMTLCFAASDKDGIDIDTTMDT